MAKKFNGKPDYHDVLTEIADVVRKVPDLKERDYGSSMVLGGVPVAQLTESFRITQVSFSPSRLLKLDAQPLEKEKEELKEKIVKSFTTFREAEIQALDALYSPDPVVMKKIESYYGERKELLQMDVVSRMSAVKEMLAEDGFGEDEIQSVIFTPKDKAIKFASDKMMEYVKTVMEDFDIVFGKLGSMDPVERERAVVTAIQAWEEAAEEWEVQERERLSKLSPGILARLSKTDVSFAQAMANIASHGFHSMTDIDTAVGAFFVAGMFPPAAALFLLPMIIPAVMNITFDVVAKSRETAAKDQQSLIQDEMTRLFACKATGNAIMERMVLKLANGESPEKIFADFSKVTRHAREIYEISEAHARQIFSKYSENDEIRIGSAEFTSLVNDARQLGKEISDIFITDEMVKGLDSVKESAIAEKKLADATKLIFTEDGIKGVIDEFPSGDLFFGLKEKQAQEQLKEYIDVLNDVYKTLVETSAKKGISPDNKATLIEWVDSLPICARAAVALGKEYGISKDYIGKQSGTSFYETNVILKTLKEFDLSKDNPKNNPFFKAMIVDAGMRILPQETIGKIYLPDINIRTLRNLDTDGINKSLVSSIASIIEDVNEQTKKFIAAILYFNEANTSGAGGEISKILKIDDWDKYVTNFWKKFREMDTNSQEYRDMVNGVAAIFNRTVTEPGIEELVVRHVTEDDFYRRDFDIEVEDGEMTR